MSWEINDEFLERVRVLYSMATLQLGDELDNYEIVPDNLTHDRLLETFWEIENSIIDYYYKNTAYLFKDEDYQKFVNTGYHGDKNRTLRPYPIKIFGAYFSRVDLYSKLYDAFYFHGKHKPLLKEISDLVPYFKEYSKGFEYGYECFEAECVKPYLLISDDKQDIILKTFEFVTREFRIMEFTWFGSSRGFTTMQTGNEPTQITRAFEDGKIQGYYYKAWGIVFKAHQHFTKLFRDLSESEVIALKDNLQIDIINQSENPVVFYQKTTIPEKWGALLYLIELAIKNESPPESVLGMYKKDEIQKIGKDRGYKKGQFFYITVRDTKLDKPNAIASSFHKDWKEKIIKFSNNDAKIIAFLKEKYDSDSLR